MGGRRKGRRPFYQGDHREHLVFRPGSLVWHKTLTEGPGIQDTGRAENPHEGCTHRKVLPLQGCWEVTCLCHGTDLDAETHVPFSNCVCGSTARLPAVCLQCAARLFLIFLHYNTAVMHILWAQPDAGREWVVASLTLSDHRPTGAWLIVPWHSKGACSMQVAWSTAWHWARCEGQVLVLPSSQISRILGLCVSSLLLFNHSFLEGQNEETDKEWRLSQVVGAAADWLI